MRYVGLVAVLAFSFTAQQAAAQAGSPTSDLVDRATRASPRTLAGTIPPSPFSMLSNQSRAWIKAEVMRQAANPRPTADLSDDINQNLNDDMAKLAQRAGIPTEDVSNAILLRIIMAAQELVAHELKQVRNGPDPAAADQAKERLARVKAGRKEAVRMQSEISMMLVMM